MKSLSVPARVYVLATLVVGGLLAALQLYRLDIGHLPLLAVACVSAAVLQVLKTEGATSRSSHNFGWVIYAAAFSLLGVPQAFAVILFAHLVEWVWHRYPWYIQGFNIASFAVVISLSEVVYRLVLGASAASALGEMLALVTAMMVFTLANHLMVGWVIKLARGLSLSESGVFTFTPLMIDFGLLCLGVSIAMLARIDPFATVFVAVVAYLLFMVLRVPSLERKSQQDAKTGLFNDRYFDKMLHSELQRAQRMNTPLCVVMADLDLLREINNRYGHLAGDAVLKKVAQILQASAREGDVVARFGGEEFSILLPNTTAVEAVIQVEAMRKAIEAAAFTVTTSATPIKATMSFGIAERSGTDQMANDLVGLADHAVYQAKAEGRNRTCVHGVGVYRSQAVTALNVPGPVETTSVPSSTSSSTSSVSSSVSSSVPAPNEAASEAVSSTPSQDLPLAAETAASGDSVANPVKAASAATSRFVNLYVTGVALVAVGLAALLVRATPDLDWRALLIFALLAMGLEALSTTIYVRDTSVSTSVAPLLAATLALGPIGAVVVSLAITLMSQIKVAKPLNRLVFNTGNHVIAGLLCAAVILSTGVPFDQWPLLLQVGFSVLAALLVYLSTTGLLAGVVGLNTGQPFRQVWVERFSWLGLHYAALGMIAYAMILGYRSAGLLGVLLLLAPLAMLHLSQRQYINATKDMVDQLRATNALLFKQSQEVEELNQELMLALASTIDLRDPFVVEHSRHVARYAALTAAQLGLSPQRVELVRRAGLMHDIGKLAVPEAILFKPDFLSPEEYAIVKDHSVIGADLLSDFHTLRNVATYVRHHHERYDGHGYPQQLAGDKIPLEARILALADAVEAMASDRPYRQGLSVQEILSEIERNAGTQFDPAVVNAFVQVIERHGAEIFVNSARVFKSHPGDGPLPNTDDLSLMAAFEANQPHVNDYQNGYQSSHHNLPATP